MRMSFYYCYYYYVRHLLQQGKTNSKILSSLVKPLLGFFVDHFFFRVLSKTEKCGKLLLYKVF